MTEHHIDELLQRCSHLPYGPALNELLDQALELAEEAHDLIAEYRVRLLQADACAMSGDSTGLLGNFRWCLDRYDQDPVAFPSDPGDGADLLWQYKWMASLLSADPQIPAPEIHELLQEMSSHYARAGLSQGAVLTSRFEVACANGWMDLAQRTYDELAAEDQDAYAHCEACILSLKMSYLLASGEPDAAIGLLDTLLDNEFSCGQEPAQAIAIGLLPMLRAGRLPETKALHVRSYQAARKEPDNLGLVAHHLQYLVATGNLTRALQIAERHLPWLAHDPMAQREHLAFLAALGLLCDQLSAAGLSALPVRGTNASEVREFFGQHDHELRVDALGPRAWAAAHELASHFDTRNGNQWATNRTHAVADIGLEHWDLAWEDDAWLDPVSPVPAASNAAEYLRRAREYTACNKAELALGEVKAGLELPCAADITAGLEQLAMILHLGFEKYSAAEVHLSSYLSTLERAGYHDLASMLGDYGLSMHRDASAEQLSALLHARSAGHEELITRVYIDTWLAHAQLRHDQFDAARESAASAEQHVARLLSDYPGDDIRDSLLHNLYSIRIILASSDGAMKELETLVHSWRRFTPTDNSLAQVHFFLAQLAVDDSEYETGLDYAQRALAVFAGYQDRERAIRAADFSASLFLGMDQPERAIEGLRFGLHQAQLAESSQRVALLFRLAQTHVDLGEAYEAIDYLDQALEDSTPSLSAAEQGEIHDLLAEAYGLSEQFEPAAENWEKSLELFAAAGNALRELQCAEKLVNIYLVSGNFAEAQMLAERLISLAEKLSEEQGIHPMLNALMLLATVQETTGSGDAATSFGQAAELAAQHDQKQLHGQILVKYAQWHGANERFQDAVALMLQAANLFEAVHQESNAAQGIGAAASYLALAERHEEAMLLFEQSLDLQIEDPLAERTLRLRLADSLDRLDKPDEADKQRQWAEELAN